VFTVLEPVIEKVDESAIAQPPVKSNFGLWSRQPEWFRVYRVGFVSPSSMLGRAKPFSLQEFFVPYESHDLLFLKEKVVILSSRGFDILEISE
jgi:RHO1 GDP-GTP exchange protein 1/2